MRIVSRVVAFITALLTLYVVLAPILSGPGDYHSIWSKAVWWLAAGLLFAGAAAGHNLGTRFALAGTSLVLGIYLAAAVLRVLLRRGYFQPEYRLVALPATFPYWRFQLDGPVHVLLLFFSVALLLLALLARTQQSGSRDLMN